MITQEGRNASYTESIVLTDPSGTWFRYLRTFKHGPGDIEWSPDSSTIAFSRWVGRDNEFQSDLWTINIATSDLTQITDTPRRIEGSPSYSPDGGSLAITSSPRGSYDPNVRVMDADGTNQQLIETKRQEVDVTWSS